MQYSHALACLFAASLFIQGCNGKSDSTIVEVSLPEEKAPIGEHNLPIPDNSAVSDFRILLYGNSHIARQNELISTLLRSANPNITVYGESFGGGYLSDNLQNPTAVATLEENDWTHVILQGQKYSQSGSVEYSTAAAKTWIAKAKTQGITPILFPEHPQKGSTTEGQQVHDLHLAITQQQTSCLAPVGLVWDHVIKQQPDLNLHAADGNHANETGSLLTAMIFYETITGQPAELLPYIPDSFVSQDLQYQLAKWVTWILATHPPCS
ncbi:hypothetical protein [Pseudoalteromonas mariniglutinosa]|uniref:hypothetical protein n=1 Tax=Pseudoalteromonas mariniglutinosa TaxID=206042 RepID=UPI0038509CB2